MIKSKKSIICLLAISTSSLSFSMKNSKESSYTLISTNPAQQFVIPQKLMLPSATIACQLSDRFKQEASLTLEDSTPQDVLHLISCLKKIDIITQSKKALLRISLNQNSAEQTFDHHQPWMGMQPLNQALDIMTENKKNLPKIHAQQKLAKQTLAQYISCLNSQELLTLTQNADYLFINHKHLTRSIAESIAKIMITAPSDARSLLQSIPDAFHKNVMQALNKQASIDSKLMQPYSNLLEPNCPLPKLDSNFLRRTLLEITHNVFGKKHRYCYYNTHTKTIIVEHKSDEPHTSFSLQITKKNLFEPIFIAIDNLQIEDINSIQANEDESLFICDTYPQKKSFIINLNNPHFPVITGYNHYLFKTENPATLYAASDDTFGVLDVEKNTFNSNITSPSYIRNIQCNNNQSIIIIHTGEVIYIGKKIDNSLQFTQIDAAYFAKYNIDCPQYSCISDLCLHPHKDKLLVLVERKNDPKVFCMINLKTGKSTLLLWDKFDYSYGNQISFLSDDILYFGLFNQHRFINIATGNHWNKKQCCHPLLFTADKTHSLEINSIYSNGKNHQTLKMIPLFDKHISEAVTLLNKGEFPLLLFDISQSKPNTIVILDDKDEYEEYLQLKDSPLGKIIDSSYTVVQKDNFSYFDGLLRHYCPTNKSIKEWTAAAACVMAGLALYRIIDYFDMSKGLTSSDKHSLVENIIKFAFFLMRV